MTAPGAGDDGRGRLAEALSGHEPIYRDGYLTGEPGYFTCECGKWISDPEHEDVTGDDHRRHLADVLLPVVSAVADERAAQALEEAADELEDRVRTWVLNLLRDRAAALTPPATEGERP